MAPPAWEPYQLRADKDRALVVEVLFASAVVRLVSIAALGGTGDEESTEGREKRLEDMTSVRMIAIRGKPQIQTQYRWQKDEIIVGAESAHSFGAASMITPRLGEEAQSYHGNRQQRHANAHGDGLCWSGCDHVEGATWKEV